MIDLRPNGESIVTVRRDIPASVLISRTRGFNGLAGRGVRGEVFRISTGAAEGTGSATLLNAGGWGGWRKPRGILDTSEPIEMTISSPSSPPMPT